jgi:Domain of unknown function (DUF4173)
MNERTKIGLEILEAALLLGILGDVLLRSGQFALNVLVGVLGFSIAFCILAIRRKPELWSKETGLLHVALVFFAACFAWRSSGELLFLDAFVILSILAVLTLPALDVKTQLAGVSHYAIGWLWSGVSAAFAPFILFTDDIKWKTIPQTGWTKHLASVLRGLAIAAPILIVFTAFFMAADSVFQGIIEKTFNINPGIILGHLFIIGVISWLSAGYLRASLIGSFHREDVEINPTLNVEPELKQQPLSVTETIEQLKETPKEAPKPEPEKTWSWQNFDNSILPEWATLGAIEVCIVLGLINLLFLSFVITQIPYLFGGFELVQTTDGLKLADYARRGFGELVIVAALVLPILLSSHWLLRKGSPKLEWIFRVFAGIQIALLFVIMISAAQRLFVLTGNLGYGLTTIRFYPMVFMIWLALVFVWFAMTVLRGVRSQFAWGAFWTGVFILAGLHFMNPDDFIARTNIRLMQEGRQFDAYYHTTLSDDAIPALIDAIPLMNNTGKCEMERRIIYGLHNGTTDLRNWNYSRETAYEKMNEAGSILNNSVCPKPVINPNPQYSESIDGRENVGY